MRDTNLIELESEKTLDVKVSLDEIKIPASDGKTIENIVIDGITYTFDAPVDATNQGKIKQVIRETLHTAHEAAREARTMTAQEIYEKIAIEFDGTDTYLYHLGLLTVASVSVGGTSITATRKPTQFSEGKFEAYFVAGDVDVSYDGQTDTATEVTAANAVAKITASLAAVGLDQYGVEAVAATKDIDGNATDVIVVTIYADANATFDVAGQSALRVSAILNFK